MAALIVLSAMITLRPPPPVSGQSADPSIALVPNCGPIGSDSDDETYVIEVRGEGFEPSDDDFEDTFAFNFGGGRESFSQSNGMEAFVGPDGRFEATITPSRRPDGTYTVDAAQRGVRIDGQVDSDFNLIADAVFTVPCAPATTEPRRPTTTTEAPGATTTTAEARETTTTTTTITIAESTTTTTTTPTALPTRLTPTLELVPPLGPTGFVTTAVGTGFPPDVAVTLTWDPGIGTSVVRTDAGGSLRLPVLVLPNDLVGPRSLVAALSPVPGLEVAPVPPAPYLVVPGTVQPPRSATRGLVFRG